MSEPDDRSKANIKNLSDDELEAEVLEPYRFTDKAKRNWLIREYVKREREQSETRHKETVDDSSH